MEIEKKKAFVTPEKKKEKGSKRTSPTSDPTGRIPQFRTSPALKGETGEPRQHGGPRVPNEKRREQSPTIPNISFFTEGGKKKKGNKTIPLDPPRLTRKHFSALA